MKALRYNTGALEYEAAYGKFKISIDPNLLKRVQTAMQEIEELKTQYPDEINIDTAWELDGKIKEIVNRAFGTDISRAAFGGANVLCKTESGLSLFEEFFNVFLPELRRDAESLAEQRQQRVRPEVAKYLPPEQPKQEQPDIDVDKLTPEQKKALLEALLQ